MVGSIEEAVEKADKLNKDAQIKMSETFKFDLITPERSILSTETTEVIIPAFEGQMTVLKIIFL